MRRILFNIICGIIFLGTLCSGISLKAQESKKEARIKIVCIDDGKKTIVDTILCDFEGNAQIMKFINKSDFLNDSLIRKTINSSIWFTHSGDDKKAGKYKIKTICLDDDDRLIDIDSLSHVFEFVDMDEDVDVDIDVDVDVDFDEDDEVIVIKKRVLKKEHDDGAKVKVIKMGDKDGRVMIIHEDEVHIKCQKELKKELRKEKKRRKKKSNRR